MDQWLTAYASLRTRAGVRYDGEPVDAEAHDHYGVWDELSWSPSWGMPLGGFAAVCPSITIFAISCAYSYPRTNVRAPLLPKQHTRVGPGHHDWTELIVGLDWKYLAS